MGTNNIPTATDGTAIPASNHNSLKEALANDQVPRNTSGAPVANQGDLGTVTFPFKKAAITVGFFFPGMIMPVHTYNGAVSPGQGWMKCDARIINETNYDAEHGAGSWATYIGSSVLDGKHLPGMTDNTFITGAAATAQDGSSALTKVGNAGSQINISHTHTGPSHNHQWYIENGNPTEDQTYNSGGSAIDINSGTNTGMGGSNKGALATVLSGAPFEDDLVPNSYTSNAGTGNTSSSLSGSQSIKPQALESVFYMRVI